jgi:hypothetical protein
MVKIPPYSARCTPNAPVSAGLALEPILDLNAPLRDETTRGRSGRIPFNSAGLGRDFP